MQLRRLAETDRQAISFVLDGETKQGLDGDTLLVAILTNADHLRSSEFGDGPRAGFCMMGACHDCMVWRADGMKLRACTTRLEPGMEIFTRLPEAAWPKSVL